MVGNGNGNAVKGRTLLIIAVHAVLLEFGFVCVDRLSQRKIDTQPKKKKRKIDKFHLPEGGTPRSGHWRYTVPDLIGVGSEVLETVEFRFQTWGKFMNVIGSLSKNPPFRLCLDKFCFVPSLEFVCKSMTNGSSKSFHESKVLEFWRIVKDKLALPLLTDLCEKTGLIPPPCFMRLPAELKLKILEFLPSANDFGMVGCVSSELMYLSSYDDMWKPKYEEELALLSSYALLQWDIYFEAPEFCWKDKFHMCRTLLNSC
ncbi:hypothetical protein IFM89_038649 [Coptis chinensis]|uniref:F-box domain-containing protein n=1 Tax=Coptis chinensis TaxID=261450 RepID=A0A835I8Q5_9MAGN|nr:hypothetical protein IFM89_038649 [Coptis chinensis]